MSEQSTQAIDPAQAFAALESFVIDNEDLVELEERIGRFNIFDALGIVRVEIRHSNFLAWLLDPAESHGTGQLFLRSLLMDVLRQTPHDLRPMSPVELDGLELGGVEIKREADNIDILIAAEEPPLVIAIENKIDAGEHSDQLNRYRAVVEKRYPDHKKLFVFLTRSGSEPSDDAWTMYSYAELHSTLTRARRLSRDSIGDDVGAFVDHYLRMIGSRFMNDPKIDELCERIYKNHRQALDLIFERKGDARSQLVSAFAQAIEYTGYQSKVSDRTSISYRFTPQEWIEVLPPINHQSQMDPSGWIFMQFKVDQQLRNARIEIRIGPTTDAGVRSRLLDAMRKSSEDYEFRLNRERVSERWTKVYLKYSFRSQSPLEINDELLDKVRQSANDSVKSMQKMTELFREVFSK